MSTSLIGLGYCGWDHLCVVPHIPADDKVKILERLEQGGGPAATATYAAARLGIASAFWSAVGDDSQGDRIIAALAAAGVDVSGIRRRPGAASPTAYCWIEEQTGKRSIAWSHGEAAPLQPAELPWDELAAARLLHLDGHQTAAAITAADFARQHNVTVSLDAGTAVPGIEKLLDLADIVIASEKFAAAFSGQPDPRRAARQLFGCGTTRLAAVTLGARGAVAFDGVREYTQASFPVVVRDTTGAGDVFHGAFAAAFLHGLDWQQCLRQASMTAALKCTRLGGRTGIPDAAGLAAALKQHEKPLSDN